jgi:hypothetical protein
MADLTVSTPSDIKICKAKSRLSQLRSLPNRRPSSERKFIQSDNVQVLTNVYGIITMIQFPVFGLAIGNGFVRSCSTLNQPCEVPNPQQIPLPRPPNASGSLQTALSKTPRPRNNVFDEHSHAAALPNTVYTKSLTLPTIRRTISTHYDNLKIFLTLISQ